MGLGGKLFNGKTMAKKRTVRLCHFSDPHVGGRKGSLAVLDALVSDAVRRGADHLLMTGDLVDRPERENLEAAIGVFKRHGLWSKERATILPGNHDVSGLTVDPAFGRSEDERKRASVVFSRITGHVNRAHPGGGAPLLHGRPVAKRIGALHLLALFSPSLRDSMGGEIREEDLRALERIFSGKKRGVRVVALHHNPCPLPDEWYRTTGRRTVSGLVDGSRLLCACSKAEVDLVLHGHVHTTGRPVDRRIDGVYVRCQATARGELRDGRRRFGYDLYEISESGWRRRRFFMFSAAIVDGMIETPPRSRPRS